MLSPVIKALRDLIFYEFFFLLTRVWQKYNSACNKFPIVTFRALSGKQIQRQPFCQKIREIVIGRFPKRNFISL